MCKVSQTKARSSGLLSDLPYTPPLKRFSSRSKNAKIVPMYFQQESGGCRGNFKTVRLALLGSWLSDGVVRADFTSAGHH